MNFQRSLSLTALLFTAVGGIVGSGWLFGPMYAAQIAGPAATLAWVIGAVLMLVLSFTFAELSANHPAAGGMVYFAQESHGALLSFTVGWAVWLSSMVVAPIETLALTQYASNYFPQLMHKVNTVPVLTLTGILFSAAVMWCMVAINFYGIRLFSRISILLVSIKLIVPVLTLAILFYADFHPQNFHSLGGFMPYGWHGVLAALPLGGVIFSFIGNSPAIQLAAETNNPRRNLPIALISSVLICALLYTLLQVTFVAGVDPTHLKQGWGKLSFSGENGPFAGIAAALGATWLVILIYVDAFISPFGTAFIYTGATARINYALAKTKFFPERFAMLNRYKVPMQAMLFNYFFGLFMFLPFPSWQNMVSFIVSCFVISYSIGPLALLPMRKKVVNPKENFSLPCGPLFAVIAFYICNLLIYWTGWETVWRLMIALGVGLIIFVSHTIRSAKSFLESKSTAQWLFPYLFGIAVISYLGNFGGKNLIHFGMDFIVIFIFSLLIYGLAMRATKAEILESRL